jgi:hypothetical protein
VFTGHPTDSDTHDTAIRMARKCRRIVQACLREDEWSLADQEFYAVIREELEPYRDRQRRGQPGRDAG